MSDDLLRRIGLTVLFIVVVVVRRVFERRADRIAVAGLRRDLDSRKSIAIQTILLAISNLAMIVYLIKPAWMAWSSLSLPGWATWLGLLLGVAGASLLVWCHVELGENFFGGLKIRSDHELVTKGPYQWARHPMYPSFLLLGVAWFLLSNNWLISGFWIAGSVLAIVTRLGQEEAMLEREFGAAYEAYSHSTGRLFPGL